MHKKRRLLIPVFLILVLIAVCAWYLLPIINGSDGAAITASGTVEAVELMVSPELAGRVVEVNADKGDTVQMGDALLRLDDELLIAQRQQAEKAVAVAQSNLEAAETGQEMAQTALKAAEVNYASALANQEAELAPVQQALDKLFEDVDVARAQAELEVAAANRALREALYTLDNFTVPSSQQSYTAMEGVTAMEALLDVARQSFEPYKYWSSSDPTREDYKEALDEAQSDYDSAVRRLEYETAVEHARAQLNQAMRDLEDVQDGPDPDAVARLETRLAAIKAAPRQAQAAVEQARVGVEQAQVTLRQAENVLAQAQSQLDLIDVQIGKLTVYAAASGVVLSRNVEPGEVIQVGAPVMTIGDLDRLTITVYVPEDRYGQLTLGMDAHVTVDSFPRESFMAQVVYIADKAEFTPRNVQTVEGRRTTVFAVELAIENPEGKLKPGMPADVEF
jgi:multidrug resistance efflux pump